MFTGGTIWILTHSHVGVGSRLGLRKWNRGECKHGLKPVVSCRFDFDPEPPGCFSILPERRGLSFCAPEKKGVLYLETNPWNLWAGT